MPVNRMQAQEAVKTAINEEESTVMSNDRWRAEIELWPYSSIKQEDVGPRRLSIVVEGNDIGDALASAEVFRKGCTTNNGVWRAPLVSIVKIEDHDDKDDVDCMRIMGNNQRANFTSPSGERGGVPCRGTK